RILLNPGVRHESRLHIHGVLPSDENARQAQCHDPPASKAARLGDIIPVYRAPSSRFDWAASSENAPWGFTLLAQTDCEVLRDKKTDDVCGLLTHPARPSVFLAELLSQYGCCRRISFAHSQVEVPVVPVKVNFW